MVKKRSKESEKERNGSEKNRLVEVKRQKKGKKKKKKKGFGIELRSSVYRNNKIMSSLSIIKIFKIFSWSKNKYYLKSRQHLIYDLMF